MIDQYNDDRTGWAQFSDDMTMRYHLGRVVSERARNATEAALLMHALAEYAAQPILRLRTSWDITVFLMCNPSDADAFQPDPTVGECVKFTRRWGSDITWVVNLWAWRSPWPADLRKRAVGQRGDDLTNDQAILTACLAATRVIAAWGEIDYRNARVCELLRSCARPVKFHHLGLTKEGHPKHPLARGKHRIPADQQPMEWTP